MCRIALLSFHGCPVARLGEKDTGGMNVYVLQIAKEFGRRGHQVDVYTRCHDPQDPQIVELGEGARVIHLKAGPYYETKEALYQYIPEFLGNLNSFEKAEGVSYDLIHSHYWFSGRMGMVLGNKWDVPHVTTFHTLAKAKLMARAGEQESLTEPAIVGDEGGEYMLIFDPFRNHIQSETMRHGDDTAHKRGIAPRPVLQILNK